jgi:hypothetical protein
MGIEGGEGGNWKRSSFCDGGQCVEVAWPECDGGACVQVSWGKSSASLANSSCVEAGEGACGLVHLRDSKDPDGPVLDFTPTQWRFVLDWIRADEIPVGVATGPDSVVWNGLDGAGQPVSLEFTYEEWDAFTKGVKLGEFDRYQVSIEDVSGALAAAGDPEGAAVVREGAAA